MAMVVGGLCDGKGLPLAYRATLARDGRIKYDRLPFRPSYPYILHLPLLVSPSRGLRPQYGHLRQGQAKASGPSSDSRRKQHRNRSLHLRL